MAKKEYIPRKDHLFDVFHPSGQKAVGCPMLCTGTRGGRVFATDTASEEREFWPNYWIYKRHYLRKRNDR